jgi:hypothetical protein
MSIPVCCAQLNDTRGFNCSQNTKHLREEYKFDSWFTHFAERYLFQLDISSRRRLTMLTERSICPAARSLNLLQTVKVIGEASGCKDESLVLRSIAAAARSVHCLG